MNKPRLPGKIVLGLVLGAMLVAGASAAYHAGSLAWYRHSAGIPGQLYDVDGASMHLYCTGQGKPAIVLESGLGDGFTIWAKVQPALSKVTKVCSYDRAGFGWSARRAGLRDADTISAELHRLLAAAGIEEPVVLMGHSIAGLYLRSYATHYPQQLAGLVFVDGATPLQDDRVPRELVAMQEAQRKELPYQEVLMALGWYRLHGMCSSVQPGMEGYRAWILADSCVASQLGAMAGELDAVRTSGNETVRAGPFGQLPLLVLSRDPAVMPSNWSAEIARGNAVVWTQMQKETAALSTNSRHVIAKRSDHYIQLDRPELVIDEVTTFIARIRAPGPTPTLAAQLDER